MARGAHACTLHVYARARICVRICAHSRRVPHIRPISRPWRAFRGPWRVLPPGMSDGLMAAGITPAYTRTTTGPQRAARVSVYYPSGTRVMGRSKAEPGGSNGILLLLLSFCPFPLLVYSSAWMRAVAALERPLNRPFLCIYGRFCRI